MGLFRTLYDTTILFFRARRSKGGKKILLEYYPDGYLMRRKSTTIKISLRTKKLSNGKLPAYYRFSAGNNYNRHPVISIMAGPGVRIRFKNHPLQKRPYKFFKPSHKAPWINIYRIQDEKMISNPGQVFRHSHFPEKYFPERGSYGLNYRLDLRDRGLYFGIIRLPNETIIRDYYGGSDLIFRVPYYPIRLGGTEKIPYWNKEWRAKYSFWFNEKGHYYSTSEPLLLIQATKEVSIELVMWGNQEQYDRWSHYFKINIISSYRRIPNMGSRLKLDPGGKVRNLSKPKSKAFQPHEVVFDIILGAIPIIGDLADIAELVYAHYTGKDKWGNKMDSMGMAIIGLSILIPFVSKGMAMGTKALTKTFGDNADEASVLIEEIASLGKKEKSFLGNVTKKAKNGKVIVAAEKEVMGQITSKVKRPKLTISDILTLDESGFKQEYEELQFYYNAYTSRKGKNALSPRKWINKINRGKPYQALKAILGNDFRHYNSLNKVKLSLKDIPVPSKKSVKMTDNILNQHTNLKRTLFEGVDKKISANASKQSLFLQNVKNRYRSIKKGITHIRLTNAQLLKNMKGSIAEVLSFPKQLEILKRVRTKYPDAQLITNVKIQLMENGKLLPPKLYSDNLIVSFYDNGSKVRIHVLFEVKSGYKGGMEATKGYFFWIEEKLTSAKGNLIFPNGTKVFDDKSVFKTLESDLKFSFDNLSDPGQTDKVIGLANAERTYITAKGKSHLGLNSKYGTVNSAKRIELDISSNELDSLAALFLKGFEG